MHKMWTTAPDVGICLCVVSPAETAEPIEVPFGLWTQADARKQVLDEGADPPEGAILEEGILGHNCSQDNMAMRPLLSALTTRR